jgi:hypothetical protein
MPAPGPEHLLAALSGLAMLALGSWLLVLDARSSLHRVYAAFLFLWAAIALVPVSELSTATASFGRWLGPLLILAFPALLPAFFLTGQKCRCVGHIHGSWKVEKAIMLFFQFAPLAFALTYVIRPSLYARDRSPEALSDPTSPVGPLYAAHGLELVAFAFVVLLLAREFWKSNTPFHRSAYATASLGFALVAGYGSVSRIALALASPVPLLERSWPRITSIAWALLAFGILLWAAVEMAQGLTTATVPEVRDAAQQFLWGQIAAFATAALLAPAVAFNATIALRADAFLGGFWALLLPVLLAYSILKHHYLGIDLAIRKGVKSGILATTFVAAFFFVSEGASNLLADRWGPVFGAAAAAVLVFLIAPLQRMADRFAAATVPHVKPANGWSPEEARTFFREQVHIAWVDGAVNAKERVLLNHLRQRLGIGAEEAMLIEERAAAESLPAREPHAKPEGFATPSAP